RQLLTLVMIPLISLLVLWGFATYLTVGDGYRLYNQGRLINDLAAYAEEILSAVQIERRESMVFLGDPSPENRTTLVRARTAVDQKIEVYRDTLERRDIQRITPDRVMALARTVLEAFDDLPAIRSEVDGRSIGGRRLMDAFTDLVDPITPFYSAVSTFPDDAVAAEGRALQRLAHARELRARVDAILAGAIAAGGFTEETYVQFVQAVGVMRAEYHETYVQMTDLYRREVDKFFAQDLYVTLARIEDQAIATRGQGPIPIDAERWREYNTTALAQLSDFQLELAVFIEEHAKPSAYRIFGRILVAGLLGLIAVVATIIVSLRIANRLADRLRDLAQSARTLAEEQLPSVVERLRHGEKVDVDAEAPDIGETPDADEIGEVGRAFNAVRRTAIATAVEQAQLRAGIANVFLNIARRSQTLVRNQLARLDVMERKTVNPDELADLFAIDHLATRMRRYSENLVILGGGRPGRNWGRPVSMQEVLRGAASESEHYERVRVQPIPPVVLDGAVVSDVIHLVAELIDNATSFSPPHTTVLVSGQMVPHGFVVEIDDRGLGMSEADLAAANKWLADPPEFTVLALSDTPRLGMFVVARIAARHGIKVSLRRSPYGGITAIVLIPPHLVAEAGAEHRLTQRSAGSPDRGGANAEADDAPERVPVGAGVRAAATGGEKSPLEADTLAVPVYRRGGPAPAPAQASPPAQQPSPLTPVRDKGSDDAAARQAAGTTPSTPTSTRSTGQQESDGGQEPPRRTHLGLPVRVRQARLAPGLRNSPGPMATISTEPPARSPEEVRRMMSAYQRGTMRGRSQSPDPVSLPSTSNTTSPAVSGPADEES
ncbi:MAG: hypothetical protein DIU79_00840, partial [Actinobacteria bacterium]